MRNLTNMTTFVTSKQPLKLMDKQSIEHSGIVKLHWQKLDVQVPESKIIIGGVELFKD